MDSPGRSGKVGEGSGSVRMWRWKRVGAARGAVGGWREEDWLVCGPGPEGWSLGLGREIGGATDVAVPVGITPDEDVVDTLGFRHHIA